MFQVIPEDHKYVAGKPPTITTTESGEVKILHKLTPCRVCGLLKEAVCHITKEKKPIGKHKRKK